MGRLYILRKRQAIPPEKGTSVKNIADAVGIKDASLYNHFKSKQEIFDSIVELVSKHISGLSETLGVPQYDNRILWLLDFS